MAGLGSFQGPRQDKPDRSISIRSGPTLPYYAPSGIVLPEDFGGAGDGSVSPTANATAINAAVAAAALTGRVDTGAIVGLLYGKYVIDQPIVLPRSGATPSRIVQLIGRATRASIIEGAGTFPADRALIEWEQPGDVSNLAGQTWHGRIADLSLWLPAVAGTKAIWHRRVGGGSGELDIANEWLQCDLENILIEGNNTYNAALIVLEVGNRFAVMRNVFGDPWRGTPAGESDTLLFQFGSTKSGVAPSFPDEDSVGMGFSMMENCQPSMRRGGRIQGFSGRLYESSLRHMFVNGGRFINGPAYHFINSGFVVMDNVRTEGGGESAQFQFTNCDTMDIFNSGPIVPTAPQASWTASTPYSIGMEVVTTGFAAGTPIASKKIYLCTTTGTSGMAEPAWPGAGTIMDGTVVWTTEGDAVGDGIVLEGCANIRWHGCHARVGSAPFSSRLVKLLTMDAMCRDCVFDNFDIVGTDPNAEIAISAPRSARNVVQGNLISGGAPTITPYAFGAGRLRGNGSPEGVVYGGVGSTYQRIDGEAVTSSYVKETGGNTWSGWVAK